MKILFPLILLFFIGCVQKSIRSFDDIYIGESMESVSLKVGAPDEMYTIDGIRVWGYQVSYNDCFVGFKNKVVAVEPSCKIDKNAQYQNQQDTLKAINNVSEGFQKVQTPYELLYKNKQTNY